MKVSQWKILHPSDTEDEQNVGISSEDEAEGLEAAPGVARHGSGRPAAPEAQPALVPVQPQVAEDDSGGKEEGPEAYEAAGVGPSLG